MIKNTQLLKEFENAIIKKEGILPFSSSIRIFESLWNEGIKLGVLPPSNPMEGIEVDIKIAKALNSCLKKSSQR
ncbi:MAG: hypothetical protein HZB79_08630 [Deltaproteobacteria bacterium]|nr:hypothetical protein [Deltaproteobacteria bacterium]